MSSTHLRSNVKKKWAQVWPDVPFPSDDHDEHVDSKNNIINNNNSSGSSDAHHCKQPTRTKRRRKGVLIDYIQRRAGDVVDILYPTDGQKGPIHIVPKYCTRDHVAKAAATMVVAAAATATAPN